jgi:hypothetical protein
VGVEETLADAVWILVGVGVAVVSAVVSGPPSDGSLNGTSTNGGKEDLERSGGGVGGVCPQSVVSGGDSEAGREVVGDGEEGGRKAERGVCRGDQASERQSDDEGG